MNYRKFDKAMQKSGVEYDVQESDTAIQIKTDPEKNEIAQRNIKPALGRDETCVNTLPGKFTVIQTDIRVYKALVEPNQNMES